DTVWTELFSTYCSKFFYQFYTLYGYKNGQYVPLVLFSSSLLPDKTFEIHNQMLTFMKEKCKEFDLSFNPKTVFVDFEKSVHLAVNVNFPITEIKGCLFHLKQAWYRKLSQLGLSSFYKAGQSKIGQWLRYIFGLPYLRPNDVSDCFL